MFNLKQYIQIRMNFKNEIIKLKPFFTIWRSNKENIKLKIIQEMKKEEVKEEIKV